MESCPASRIFSSPELITNISTGVTNLKDLSSFSRTCSQCHRGAIGVLWQTLPSPLPLLKLFEGIHLYNSVYQFKTSPILLEAQRFDYYAKSVHVLHNAFMVEDGGRHKHNKIDPHVYIIIHNLSNLRPTIFPRLRAIDLNIVWFGRVPPCLSYLVRSPKIESLSLVTPGIAISLHTKIDSLLRTCSSTLTSLSLGGFDFISSTVVAGVLQCRNLKYFTVDLTYAFSQLRMAPLSLTYWDRLCHFLPPLDTLQIRLPPTQGFRVTNGLQGRSFKHFLISGTARDIMFNTTPAWKGINTAHLSFIIHNTLMCDVSGLPRVVNVDGFSYKRVTYTQIRHEQPGFEAELFHYSVRVDMYTTD